MTTSAPLPPTAPAPPAVSVPPPIGDDPIGAPPTGAVPGGSGTGAAPPPGAARPAGTLLDDLTEASRLVGKAVEIVDALPKDDVGLDATKGQRIQAFQTNVAAQARLERQIDAGNTGEVVSQLRQADAHLEDANWQLAKKPSPDGRFNGVDVPGAARDTREGARIIAELLQAAGGEGPVVPAPPAGVPAPPTGVPAPPTGVPPGGQAPDPTYPGEDEFPTDDQILATLT